jgi:hypothetical protein
VLRQTYTATGTICGHVFWLEDAPLVATGCPSTRALITFSNAQKKGYKGALGG